MIYPKTIVKESHQTLRNVLPLFFFVCLLSPFKTTGQTPLGFGHYDSITYTHFLEARWDELIDAGNQALKNGFDNYYMRIRMGIAFFSLEQYRMSAMHFEKALFFNRTDPVIVNYLGKSYEWAGLEIEAANVERRFTIYQSPMKKSRLILKNAGLYAGYTFSGNDQKISDIDFDGQAGIYGEINSNGDMIFTHSGMTIAPLPQVWWYNGYTCFLVERNQIFMAGNRQMRKFNYDLKQHQYYSSLTIRLKNLWYVNPAFHLINIIDEPVQAFYESSSNRYSFRKSDTAYSHVLFSLMAVKELPAFSTGIAVSGSNLNNREQWQGSFTAGYYPQKNLKVYAFSALSVLAEDRLVKMHFKQKLGGKIVNWLWLEGSFHGGYLKNANDENGLLVYNRIGKIRARSSLTALFPIGEQVQIHVEYNFYSIEDQYMQYTDFNNFVVLPVHYLNHNITGGIKWKL